MCYMQVQAARTGVWDTGKIARILIRFDIVRRRQISLSRLLLVPFGCFWAETLLTLL